MSLAPGVRIGPYEVEVKIGEGGMGQVYRATDTRLKRHVAIKILPPSLAGDADRLARLQREAEVLASLNHPNIAQIHGLEDSGGTTALVMELVEGPTLADRIAQGAVPIDEALQIAKQIAEALEAAHEQGIVHRDLKLANIKVRPDGTVKVLDFGLAKALEPGVGIGDPGFAHPSQAPTITSPALMTGAGVILGTAAYMSPEQARGGRVDRRTDLWAFGVVLYEMLTGARLFGPSGAASPDASSQGAGASIADVLAAVLTKEPDWTALPASTPAPIRKLLRRCLEKDRRRRMESAADARLEIEDALAAPAADGAPPSASTSDLPASSARRARLVSTVAVAAVLVAVALAVPAVRYLQMPPPAAPLEMRLEINTPATEDPVSFALSPDGRQVVYAAFDDDGGPRLWLRALASTTARPLAGTDGATYPFWSPDSRSIGFFADQQLKRLDLDGGPPQVLASAAAGLGGTWNDDGVILVTTGAGSPLRRIAATGGEPVEVTTKEQQQLSHRFPRFLPGGRQFLFFAQGSPEIQGIYLGSLDAPDVRRLTGSDTGGAYLSPGSGTTTATSRNGWLVWMQGGRLRAQRLDVEAGQLTGEPVTLAEPVAYDPGSAAGGFSVSDGGLLAYRSGAAGQRRQLAWFDRTGKVLGLLGAPDANSMMGPRVSPDGRRVAVNRNVQGNGDLWLLDGARTSRFTFDAALDTQLVWSPDGRRIAFSSNRRVRDLYVKPAGGAGTEELLVESEQTKVPTDWSRDGRLLLFYSFTLQSTRDLWVVPLDGNRTPRVFLKTDFEEEWARFSPDGRWVAYMSNESGRQEIYVRPFLERGSDAGGGEWQVSTAGGIHPAWRPDGKELYYLAPDGRMMAAPIDVRGAELEPGAPVTLFRARIVFGGLDTGAGPQYDVAQDGRFLINTVSEDATAAPITILQNWQPPAR